MLVNNEAGVLARVVGLFSGRGYNIESLTVAEVDPAARTSRITIVTSGTPAVIEQIEAQLNRVVPVRSVTNWTAAKAGIEREMALIKVAGTGEKRMEALRMADAFRARAVDTTHTSFRVRDHRRAGQDRQLHRPDAAAGAGGCVAHRRRRDFARPGSDVTTADARCDGRRTFLPPAMIAALFSFALVSSITPGPNNIMLAVSGVNFGLRRTVPHMLGIFAGLLLIMIAIGLGLGFVFSHYPLVRQRLADRRHRLHAVAGLEDRHGRQPGRRRAAPSLALSGAPSPFNGSIPSSG